MGGGFVSTFRGVVDGNTMDHGDLPNILRYYHYMLMMDA